MVRRKRSLPALDATTGYAAVCMPGLDLQTTFEPVLNEGVQCKVTSLLPVGHWDALLEHYFFIFALQCASPAFNITTGDAAVRCMPGLDVGFVYEPVLDEGA